MSDLRKAAQMALEALALASRNGSDGLKQYEIKELDDATNSIHAALAQPELEQKSLSQKMTDAGFKRRDHRITCDECGGKFTVQILPIHNCVPQPEQKPVAWMSMDKVWMWSNKDKIPDRWIGNVIPLYTAPPQRIPPLELTEECDE
jgi:hypothetical protein